ncbi:MAG: hypothetical protein KDD62_15170, partial [Bdellovibrionales bacterium]|nr:hypothetical protein [Bdellovibrionales bacterium]
GQLNRTPATRHPLIQQQRDYSASPRLKEIREAEAIVSYPFARTAMAMSTGLFVLTSAIIGLVGGIQQLSPTMLLVIGGVSLINGILRTYTQKRAAKKVLEHYALNPSQNGGAACTDHSPIAISNSIQHLAAKVFYSLAPQNNSKSQALLSQLRSNSIYKKLIPDWEQELERRQGTNSP